MSTRLIAGVRRGPASFLVVQGDEQDTAGFYLLSFGEQLDGDTWHQSLEEAMAQAKFQFGHITEWMTIPDHVRDYRGYWKSLQQK